MRDKPKNENRRYADDKSEKQNSSVHCDNGFRSDGVVRHGGRKGFHTGACEEGAERGTSQSE